MKRRYYTPAILVASTTIAMSCVSAPESSPSFRAAEASIALQSESDDAVEIDGSYESYVEHALRHRPELRASVERWRAARHRISAVDELPPLSVGYGFFVQSVETRVGPQRHRVSIQQSFPWPGKAQADAELAAARARIDEERFSEELLHVRWQVAEAYWDLWAVERHHMWHHQHEEIARAIAASIRGRVEVGNATVADVGQAELLISRTVDKSEQAREAHSRASYELARAASLSPSERLEIADVVPTPRVPDEPMEELVAAATEQPRIRALARMREAAHRQAERASRTRYPDFTVGADWIETGPAIDPTMPESGKDPIIASLSVKVPLWSGETFAQEDAANAEAMAYAADEAAAKRDAEAAVLSAASTIHDSARRVRLYERTLIPQAEAVLGSVRGAYEAGRAGVAPLLLAQNELLELRLALAMQRAEHERQWARLQRLVGRPVATREFR